MQNKMNWSQKIITRFWSKVNYPGNNHDCWEWNAYRDKNGYGYFYVNKFIKMILSHRFSFEYFNGAILNNLDILHKCDNPSCCNPNHLTIGTHIDNMHDASIKGRMKNGHNIQFSKLTEENVLEILDQIRIGNYTTCIQICDIYNVSFPAINDILLGKTWKHITNKLNQNELKLLKTMIERKGSNHQNAILNESQVIDIKTRLKNGEKGINIAKLYGVGPYLISHIKNGKIWKQIII